MRTGLSLAMIHKKIRNFTSTFKYSVLAKLNICDRKEKVLKKFASTVQTTHFQINFLYHISDTIFMFNLGHQIFHKVKKLIHLHIKNNFWQLQVFNLEPPLPCKIKRRKILQFVRNQILCPKYGQFTVPVLHQEGLHCH